MRLSATAGVILGSFELVAFLALAVTLIVAAGPHNTLAVFGAHTGNSKGWGAVIPGVLYAVFGIIGFEAAAPLSRRHRPLICLAWMILGVGLLGYFMVRDRSRIAETRRVFTEEPPEQQRKAA